MKATRRVQAAAAGFALLIILSACGTTNGRRGRGQREGRELDVEYRRYLGGRPA